MPTSRPGPAEINAAPTGVVRIIESEYDRRDFLVGLHSEHKARLQDATNIANGLWYTVWPDLTQTAEAPTVANLVEMGVSHWSSIFGLVLPTVRVPVGAHEDVAQGKRGARKRERRLRELFDSSNVSELSAMWGADYAIGGNAILAGWVNFDAPPADRNPYLMRFDPRFAYPLKDDNGNITELLIARRLTSEEAKLLVPKEYGKWFDKLKDDEIEEWFWYTKDSFRRYIVDVTEKGRKGFQGLKIVDLPNKIGVVPAVEVPRPTADGQRRGVFDQAMHLLRTMHRLMSLTIVSTEDHVYPSMVEWNVADADKIGPGSMHSARSPDAFLTPVSSPTHFDAKDMIARIMEDARQSSMLPQQLFGEPGASIASGRAIGASQGGLDARLGLAHAQFETAFGKAAGFLLALDEKYCNTKKTIVGDWRDNKKAESWLPERDIAGQYGAVATYGIGAGSDPANIETRIQMAMGSGLSSRQTAREQTPWINEPEGEAVKVLREQFQDALTAGLLQAASQGQVEPAAKALELLSKDDVSIEEVVGALVEFLAQPEPAPGPGGAAAAAQGAESLARGGIPGNAEQAPPGLGLPPLGDLLGQDARLVS